MSMLFDGGNDLIRMNAAASINDIWGGDATVCGWMNQSGFGGGGVGRLFDKSMWLLNVTSAVNAISFLVNRTVTAGNWTTPLNSISNNTTYFVAVTYNGVSTASVPIIYINAVSQALTTVTSPSGGLNGDSGNALRLGNSGGTVTGFQGWLEDMRIYRRILSAGEIATLYNSFGSDRIISNLSARWLGVGPANVVMGNEIDLSGNGNTGVPANGTLYGTGVTAPKKQFVRARAA